MIRNMDLLRKILIAVEEQYEDTVIYNLQIEGYDRKEVAYHCKILHSGNLISNYDGQFADDEIYSFAVGSLTWSGHEFLDKIKSDTVWNNTKKTITEKGLPVALDVVKDVASAIITGMTQAAIKGL